VLFDMDGLLVDSEPVWTVAETELAQRLGGTWDDALKAQVVGTRLETAVPIILSGLGHDPTPALVSSTLRSLLARMVELFEEGVTALPGALELVAEVRSAGVPVALVSSSYRVLVDAAVGQLGLHFDAVVAGDEVGLAKPHPEPYLRACALLGVPPERAVVLEDSPSGIRSGEDAGCAVVAVPSVAGVTVEPGPRRRVVASLTEVDVAGLDRLVRVGA
jgi:HAD superfamily hydrolase (TIGR01509 family)